MRTDSLCKLTNIHRWYGDEHVLQGVDLELPRGQVTALLGRNGCGKSTLMRVACGLLGRDDGEALVLGQDPESFDPATLNRLAYVNDSSSIPGTTPLRCELELHRRLRGDRWDESRVQELVKRFDLDLNKVAGALSKGQLARFRIVLALAADPELLLLDEPALGLDLFARRDLLEVMIETVETEDRAILISSHLIDDVERVADRVAFLHGGEMLVQGAVEDLRARYRKLRCQVSTEQGEALQRAAREMLGVRRVFCEIGSPKDELSVVFEDFSKELLAQFCERTGVEAPESPRRMSLREIYFEVLGAPENEVL